MSYIDRDKVMDLIARHHTLSNVEVNVALLAVARKIYDIPSADVEPIRRGRWIHNGFMEVKCNNCENVFHELEATNYCPNCGAKMDLDEVDE